MRTIEYTSRFKRDYKRELKGVHRSTLDQAFQEVLGVLIHDLPLPARLRDHPLTGEWRDHRDLHLKPDLVVIYRKPTDSSVEFVRIGSHSELEL